MNWVTYIKWAVYIFGIFQLTLLSANYWWAWKQNKESRIFFWVCMLFSFMSVLFAYRFFISYSILLVPTLHKCVRDGVLAPSLAVGVSAYMLRYYSLKSDK